jgi:hypothetical protein
MIFINIIIQIKKNHYNGYINNNELDKININNIFNNSYYYLKINNNYFEFNIPVYEYEFKKNVHNNLVCFDYEFINLFYLKIKSINDEDLR